MNQLRGAQTGTRIKELEEEVRRLSNENVGLKGELERLQKRWDRLKEGARRRRRESEEKKDPKDPESGVQSR